MEEQQPSYEDIKKKLNEETEKNYNKFYVYKHLKSKERLRKIFLSVVKNSPARIAEIFEGVLFTKQTCYSLLHHLLELKVVDRVYIMDIKENNAENPEAMRKFDEWTKNMPNKLRRYYLAKTSYWYVTKFGEQFAANAYTWEQEFKQKNQDKEGGENEISD